MPLLSFWPFCSGVIPSTPSLSLRARLQLPTGSCHPPLLPTASCCPKSSSGPCAASLRTSGSWGWSIFLGALSHHWPEGSLLSAALVPSSFACPSSGDLHGSRWQRRWLPGWQCPGGTASPASASGSKCLLFGGQRRPRGGEGGLVGVCKATGSPTLAVGHCSAAPGSAWLLHTHEVPVWHVEEQQLGPACGRLWQPCWGGQPHAPPSQKHPLCCRELLTQARV